MGGLGDEDEEETPDADGDEEDDAVDVDSEEEDVPLPVDEEEESDLEDIEDEDLPMSSSDVIMGAKHCITHFLELILAGGVTAYGFGSTRKQKKEIDDLKKGKRG